MQIKTKCRVSDRGFGRRLPAGSGVLSMCEARRAFPVDQRVELIEFRARDSVRHRRILQGGIVYFAVESTYNPYTVGCSNYQSRDLTKPDRAIDGIFRFGQHELSVISQLLHEELYWFLVGLWSQILSIVLLFHRIAVNGQILPIDPTVFATSSNRGTIIASLAYLAADAYMIHTNQQTRTNKVLSAQV